MAITAGLRNGVGAHILDYLLVVSVKRVTHTLCVRMCSDFNVNPPFSIFRVDMVDTVTLFQTAVVVGVAVGVVEGARKAPASVPLEWQSTLKLGSRTLSR